MFAAAHTLGLTREEPARPARDISGRGREAAAPSQVPARGWSKLETRRQNSGCRRRVAVVVARNASHGDRELTFAFGGADAAEQRPLVSLRRDDEFDVVPDGGVRIGPRNDRRDLLVIEFRKVVAQPALATSRCAGDQQDIALLKAAHEPRPELAFGNVRSLEFETQVQSTGIGGKAALGIGFEERPISRNRRRLGGGAHRARERAEKQKYRTHYNNLRLISNPNKGPLASTNLPLIINDVQDLVKAIADASERAIEHRCINSTDRDPFCLNGDKEGAIPPACGEKSPHCFGATFRRDGLVFRKPDG